MQVAYSTLLNRPTSPGTDFTSSLALDGKEHPRILALGGDHTIVLPILGALNDVYGPISVLHFDAHLDTWSGHELGGAHTEQHKVVGSCADPADARRMARSSGRRTSLATSTRRPRRMPVFGRV